MRSRYIPVGWRQLNHNKLRLFAALAGIVFAVILMLVQQGFRDALYKSAVRWHESMNYDIVMVSPKAEYLLEINFIPRSRIMQAAGVDGVDWVTPVYLGRGPWRNPANPSEVWPMFIVAFDPTDKGFENIATEEQREMLRLNDYFLFDSLSRPEYGPVPDLLAEQGELKLEMNSRSIRVGGLFQVGTSFGINGALVTSDLSLLRLFPNELRASNVSFGLVKLEAGVDALSVQQAMRAALPADVRVMTRQEFIDMDVAYWNRSTPIGYIFDFGVIMGFIVGAIIVYQILFSDVQDHIKEYATLKAMGYTNGYLSRVVMQEAVILAVAGFLPALGMTYYLFLTTAEATNLPLVLTPQLGLNVLVLTLIMCAIAGMLALRKVRSADPADVF